MNNKKTILHLSLIDGIGPSTIAALSAHDNLADVYTCSTRDIMQRYGISQTYAHKIVTGLADMQRFEKECALIERHDISWATLCDAEYPNDLRAIHAPPPVIYWQGTLPTTDKTIAIVGSRKANRYGEHCIETIVKPLVENGWCIVSGGALGADAMAHEAAVQAKGQTVAVLGSGLLRPYPRTNLRLFDRILETNGALVSCFPLEHGALPGNFPARNRVIAGMSKGCVVIQAAKKSGARITALFALEQGREVFAIPGPIGDELSQGCNALIQEGAKLVASADDILAEFNTTAQRASITPMAQQQSIMDDLPSVEPENISIEGHIYRLCRTAVTTDELLMETELSLSELTDKLFNLQLEGKIEQNSAGLWVSLR